MAEDFKINIDAELDTAEAEKKLNSLLNEKHKITIDVDVSGQDTSKKLKQNIENGIKNVKIDTSALSKSLADSFNIDYGKMSTVSCIVYTISAYMMLYKVCRPFNLWHGILFAMMGICYIACVAAFPWFFDISALNTGCILIAVLLIFPIYPMQRGIEMLFDLSRKIFTKENK